MANRRRGNGQGTLFKRRADGPWVMAWYSHDGKRKTVSTHTSDKALATRILRRRLDNATARREGLIDPAAERSRDHNAVPLASHLSVFKADLTAKGNTARHAGKTHSMATRILTAAKAERISQLSPSATMQAIENLRRNGRSLRTCNAHLRAIKSFSRWLVRDGRAVADPLAHLRAFNDSTDRRLQRRALIDDELASLIDATEHAGEYMGMSGANRAMLYRIATGSRPLA